MIINAILSGGTIVEILQAIVFGAVAVLLSISVHEWAHAVVAYMMGDYTQKSYGRMTLNPIKHLNPIGMIMFLLLGFGWANPVMMDSRNFKRPKLGIILTSLAGPFANFLSGFIWLLIYVVLSLHSPATTFLFRICARCLIILYFTTFRSDFSILSPFRLLTDRR